MTPNTLAGTRRGPVSAIRPQPRHRHEAEVGAHTPTSPWGSRRLPATLSAGTRRRTLFRSLLRRAEGVPVEFTDGATGTVEQVVLKMLGFDFWPEALLVAMPGGSRRAEIASVTEIDVRTPRIRVGVDSGEPLERLPRRRDQRDDPEAAPPAPRASRSRPPRRRSPGSRKPRQSAHVLHLRRG